jgi:hypothetical protein
MAKSKVANGRPRRYKDGMCSMVAEDRFEECWIQEQLDRQKKVYAETSRKFYSSLVDGMELNQVLPSEYGLFSFLCSLTPFCLLS